MEFAMSSKSAFKPGDKISLTIKFDDAVDQDTTLTVEYGAVGEPLKDQTTFQRWFLLNTESVSSDRKTLIFSATVAEHQASGTYPQATIAAEHQGERRQEISLQGVPPITIDNPARDEKVARIPSIASIKPS